MGKLSEIERELISAYLDDALDGLEREQAEQLLEQNADAAQWFEQLTTMRSHLKLIASPKSLSSGFAERVIAQARSVAACEGLSASHHVRQSDAATIKPAPPADVEKFDSRRGMYLVLATLAASLLALAIIPSRPAVAPQGLVQSQAPVEIEESKNSLPTAEPATIESRESQLVETSRRAPEELHEQVNPLALRLVNLIDAQMSPTAWDAGEFDDLLKALKVEGISDFSVEKDALRSLIEKNLPGDILANSQEEIGLFYIHCSAAVYEQLHAVMATSKSSYPQVKQVMMNIGPDGTDKLLYALEHSGRSGVAKNFSRLITLAEPQARFSEIVPAYEPLKALPGNVEAPTLDQLQLRELQDSALFGSDSQGETDAVVILRKLRS